MGIKYFVIGCSFASLAACATTPVSEPVPGPVPDTIAEVESTPVPVTEFTDTAEIASKYERIEYGQELTEVCSKQFPAEGKLAGRPNLQVMWENYLYDRPDGIWGEIGGMVEINGNLPLDQGRWTNACTIRLSHMMNQAGHKIPNNGNKTVSGANGDQYYYRIRDAEAYLIEAFGKPDLAITDGSAGSFDLPDHPGIVLMDFPGTTFFGHVTVWNGAGSVDNADIGGHRLLFWKLPCFIPDGRNAEAMISNSRAELTL